MIFKHLMVSKLLKSKISNNRVAPYLKHTHIYQSFVLNLKTNQTYSHTDPRAFRAKSYGSAGHGRVPRYLVTMQSVERHLEPGWGSS